MNTASSGSGRIDSTNVLPSGEIRGQTKLINITEDVGKYAAEQGVGEAAAIHQGLQSKAREFTDSGGELYSAS